MSTTNVSRTSERERLATLLAYAQRGTVAIVLYDRVQERRLMTSDLRERLTQPVHEVQLSERRNNPVGLIRVINPEQLDVVSLFDLESAFPEALGYLDLLREVLVDMKILLVCWVRDFEHRKLKDEAPNFYAFRTAEVFDLSTGPLPPEAVQITAREVAKTTSQEIADMYVRSAEETFRLARQAATNWSRASILGAVAGLVMVLAGLGLLFVGGKPTIGMVTSVSGIVPELVAGLFFKQYMDAKRLVEVHRRVQTDFLQQASDYELETSEPN